jgi:hypothetical protein
MDSPEYGFQAGLDGQSGVRFDWGAARGIRVVTIHNLSSFFPPTVGMYSTAYPPPQSFDRYFFVRQPRDPPPHCGEPKAGERQIGRKLSNTLAIRMYTTTVIHAELGGSSVR